MTNPEKIVLITIATMILTQVTKFIIHSLVRKTMDEKILFSTGGMPSSHSAMVSALTMSIFLYDGFGYPFAISLILMLVVAHDSAGVRYEASKHARDINVIKAKLNLIENIETEELKLKESLGHRPREVMIGILLGVLFAILGYNML